MSGTGRRYLLTNSSSARGTRFFANGSVITNPANLNTATEMVIDGFGHFKVSDLGLVKAFRSFNKAVQVDNYDVTSVVNTVTSTLTSDVVLYVTPTFVYTGVAGQYMQNDAIEMGRKYPAIQVVIPSGTTAANFEAAFLADLFNQVQFTKNNFSGNYILNPSLPIGATVSGEYVDGTIFSAVTLTVPYVGKINVDLTKQVKTFTLITNLTLSGNDYRWIWSFKVLDEFPQVKTYSSIVTNFVKLVSSTPQVEGRNTGLIMNEQYFLPTIDRYIPYTPNYQNPELTSLYSELLFTIGKKVDRKTWQLGADTIMNNEVEYLYFIKESTDTLNATVVIDSEGNVTQGLISALLTVFGLGSNYEYYNENYLNGLVALPLRTAVATGVTVWNQANFSGVQRTVTSQLAADVTAFIN